MLTFLAFLGRLASPLLAFTPGLSPRLAMFLAGLMACVVVIGGPAAIVWLNMRGEVKVAVAQCENSCNLRVSRMETAAERTISDILSSVDSATDASIDVIEYCTKHPTLCRSER